MSDRLPPSLATSPAPLKLTRPNASDRPGQTETARNRSAPSPWTTLTALAGIVLFILVTARLFRRHAPHAPAVVPGEVVELLGKRQIDQKQTIHLIRCGSRILVVGSAPAGLNTLTEFTDPAEVDALAELCRSNTSSATLADSLRTLLRGRHSATLPSADNNGPHRSSPQSRSDDADGDRFAFAKNPPTRPSLEKVRA